MITIEFDGFLKLQASVTDLEHRLTDRTRLFSDFIAPLVAGEIAEVFETEGRGESPPLSAESEAEKAITHPGNIARFSSSEMIWGVDGGFFEARYGENSPESHEAGDGVPAHPVFALITVGGQLDENIEKLTEKWAREEIAEVERRHTNEL